MNHGRTDGRTHARTHARTTRKHIASAGAYRRRRRLNNKQLESTKTMQTATSFIFDLSTVCTTNTASYDRRPCFPGCSRKSMEQPAGGSDVSARSLQTFKSKSKSHLFFHLILVIFLLGLILYCKVTKVRCIFHFNSKYVCMYVMLHAVNT